MGALLLTLGVVLAGWLAARTPRRNRRLLVLSGSCLVLALTVQHLWVVTDKPVWPLVLSGAAFVYFWWLGILLFDLAFLWHRYVRHSVALGNLHAWWSGKEAEAAAAAAKD